MGWETRLSQHTNFILQFYASFNNTPDVGLTLSFVRIVGQGPAQQPE